MIFHYKVDASNWVLGVQEFLNLQHVINKERLGEAAINNPLAQVDCLWSLRVGTDCQISIPVDEVHISFQNELWS